MKVKEESKKVGLKLNIKKTKIMASGPITSWPIDGERMETVRDYIFLGSKITADGDFSREIKKSYDQPSQHIKKQRHHFADKGPSSQSYGFSSSHVWMWELDRKEGWTLKNWCFWTVVLEKTFGLQGRSNQSWIFIGKTDAEAETPILSPPDEKSQPIRRDPDAGKDCRQEEKGMTEDAMPGWQHWLDGHEFEQAPGDGEGQGSWTQLRDWKTTIKTNKDVFFFMLNRWLFESLRGWTGAGCQGNQSNH